MKKHPTTFAIAVGLIALVFGPNTYHLIRLYWLEHRLDRRLAELSKQQEQLLAEQQRLASDPTYVEGLIRSTFKVAKEGEIVIPLNDEHSRHDN
ncbi:MAG: septum formation initiator family protein [Candidatus Omnitrophica bacterium]|nr:septum formation initiator family protein [Candidatus Omnitrophota bacterium]